MKIRRVWWMAMGTLMVWLLTSGAWAQTLTNLHVFQWDPTNNPTDGAVPQAGLVQGVDGLLYGTTHQGGTNEGGTVFTVTTNGTYTTLWQFGVPGDGFEPEAGLIQGSDSNFYGVTSAGGPSNDNGIVFQITPGGALTNLHSFTAADGDFPLGGLVQGSDGNFYGTTSADGPNSGGTVFKLTPDGAYTVLHAFGSGDDGYQPAAALVQASDGNLYGTTPYGGTDGNGIVFQITPDGSVYNILHTFSPISPNGDSPVAGLIQGRDGYLYGTTTTGGDWDAGVVYRISTNGDYVTLYSFTEGADEAFPKAVLIQASDGNFYGTTYSAVNEINAVNGTVFQITPSGTLTTVYTFTGGTDSGYPLAGLVQDCLGFLYGTTSGSGTNSPQGTVFRLQIPLPTVATPVIAPNGGTFANPVTVTLSCITTGATIRYTTDGTDPTSSSPAYSVPFTLTNSATVKAIGFACAYHPSSVADASITIGALPTVATPVISPNGGTFTNSVQVTLNCITTGATIRFTTDGTDPTSSSPAYSVPFTLTSSATVKAIGFASGYNSSAEASASFTATVLPTVATPTITPDGGDFADSVKVTLKCATHKAVIYYTTDGSEPTSSSRKYKSAITLTNSATLNAVAFAGTNGPSATATASFAVNTPSITTASELPGGTVGDTYSSVTLQATGGTPPYKWKLAGGKLPAGLKLGSSGVISGKPTKADTATITVKVTDAKKGTAQQSFTVTIN
jgi:uncharacterized repeat protein (TIGR03803 family)